MEGVLRRGGPLLRGAVQVPGADEHQHELRQDGRRKKTARERRQQRLRADARLAQRLVKGLLSVDEHRGGCLSRLGAELFLALQGQGQGQAQAGSRGRPDVDTEGSDAVQARRTEDHVKAPLEPHNETLQDLCAPRARMDRAFDVSSDLAVRLEDAQAEALRAMQAVAKLEGKNASDVVLGPIKFEKDAAAEAVELNKDGEDRAVLSRAAKEAGVNPGFGLKPG